MVAFSRMQLAAALLEYDNDLDDPNAPFRSASDSALFAHIRRTGGPRPQGIKEYTDLPVPSPPGLKYLSVTLPAEGGKVTESLLDRRSQNASQEDTDDEEAQSDVEEVDLASWGLDSFIPQKDDDKPKKKPGPARTRAIWGGPTSPIPNPHSPRSPSDPNYSGDPSWPRPQSRVFSIAEDNASDPHSAGGSFGRRSQTLPIASGLRSQPLSPAEHSLSPSIRSPSFMDKDASIPFPSSPLTPEADSEEPNPFALAPPPPSRASRFDPKVTSLRHSTLSDASRLRTVSGISRGNLDSDRLSLSPSQMLDQDPRRLSRLELMRPKVLVMPSPLQVQEAPEPDVKARDGFELSTDGPPLPAGFQTATRPGARPLSTLKVPSSQSMGDGFTPNPRMSMSLSQLTFRNSLMVGGSRDVAYVDIDQSLPRAVNEGEKIEKQLDEEEVELERQMNAKPAGRLFGKSLMDDLENRKAQLRGKKRVFTGDQRPVMMERGQIRRSSTLIDPATLLPPPTDLEAADPRRTTLLRVSSQEKEKRHSSGPLVKLGDEEAGNGLPKSRSVFGVDQIWERELSKLKAIEQAERAEEEELAKKEQTKKKGKGKKRKGKEPEETELEATQAFPSQEPDIRSPSLPPVLPAVQSVRRPVRLNGEGDQGRRASTMTLGVQDWFAGSSDEDNEPSGSAKKPSRPTIRVVPRLEPVQGLNSDEEDDEDVPIAAQIQSKKLSIRSRNADSEDEDAPLSVLLNKTRFNPPPDDDDDDVPISVALKVPPRGTPASPATTQDADEDDNVPLGLKHPQPIQSPNILQDEDEDEKPLGLKYIAQQPTPAQQYQMMMQQQLQMQQQQMQQQFIMQTQAQIRNSMAAFAPSPMLGPVFPHFTGQGPASMMPGMPMLTPPVPEPSRLKVDRWRRDVVESLP